MWRAGSWVPLTIKVRPPDGTELPKVLPQLRLQIATPDGDGQRVLWTCALSAAEGKETGEVNKLGKFPQVYARAVDGALVLKTSVRLGSRVAWLELKLWQGDRVVLDRRLKAGAVKGFPIGVRDTQPIYVFVGTNEAGLREAFALAEVPSDHRPAIALVESVDDLPASPLAYQGVRGVVFSFLTPQLVTELAQLSVEQEALRTWVRLGGDIVVGFDPAALQVASKQYGEALSWLVPGTFEQGVPLSRTRASALELFAGARTPLGGLGPGGPGSSVAYISNPRGQVRAAEGRLPLVVVAPIGLGTLTWCALALDSPMLVNWRDRGLFFARLLDIPIAASTPEGEYPRAVRYGFEDLAGQLRRGLDRFPAVVQFPFGLIVSLMLIHIALIGPLDYFLFRRAGNWRWLAWLSLLGAIVAFTALAGGLGRWAKGKEIRVQQLDLVDIAASDGLVRATSWAHVFSPVTGRLSVGATPLPPDPQGDLDTLDVAFAWWGLPGEGFGGMSSLRAEALFENEGYVLSGDKTELRGLTFRPGATKALTAQCFGTTRSPGISWELRVRHDELSGWIRNQLPWPIENCRLVFGKYVYQVERIPPGELLVVDRSVPRRDLRGFLTGTQLVKEKDTYRTQTSPYDVGSTDWDYIVEMMMFHEAAGGTGYTGLLHVAEGWVDFSGRLTTDQAILVGRIATGPGEGGGFRLEVRDAQALGPSQQLKRVIYRWLLPVTADRPEKQTRRML
ncbi:MAG: hypothetical protein RMJ16_03990 [Thermoguttaceae bacterium]|nr:hypothetical protein [Thermoguttaceae bacterium]